MTNPAQSKWRLHGVRVVHANELDTNTPQTTGMNRAAAITHAGAGAEKLWAGTVVVNLDIPVAEKPEEVHWVNNIHPAPKS